MTTSTAARRSPANYNPETIADLEELIERKIQRGQQLAVQLTEAHRRRAAGLQNNPPAWAIRQEIERIEEQLDLDLSELDRRRI